MGDYGGAWRYAGGGADTRRPGSTPTKRSRREYGRGTSSTARAADSDIGYGARDRGYDDRIALGGWRDGKGLSGGGDLMRMSCGGGGQGGNDLGMGPGLGLPGGGVGNMGPLSMVGLPGEPPILGPGGCMVGLDGGIGGRAGGLNLNGVAAEADALHGNVIVLPPDTSSTLFVDGLPHDCSCREAAHIFRPFIGFKEVRLVHKDAKRVDGGMVVLCFMEFADARWAATALEALQDLSSNHYVLENCQKV